jgi:hypothetical protein
MLELRLNITESKILHSYKNIGNTKYKVFISNSALLKKLSKLAVICIEKVRKLKHNSFLNAFQEDKHNNSVLRAGCSF